MMCSGRRNRTGKRIRRLSIKPSLTQTASSQAITNSSFPVSGNAARTSSKQTDISTNRINTIKKMDLASSHTFPKRTITNAVTANATAIKQHTQEIGDLYNDPVISMEKISQAHNDLVESLEIASRLRQEGIESARENIAQIGAMTAELERKAGGLLQKGARDLGSAQT